MRSTQKWLRNESEMKNTKLKIIMFGVNMFDSIPKQACACVLTYGNVTWSQLQKSPFSTILLPKFTIFTTEASLFCNSLLEPIFQMNYYCRADFLAFLKRNQTLTFSKIDNADEVCFCCDVDKNWNRVMAIGFMKSLFISWKSLN